MDRPASHTPAAQAAPERARAIERATWLAIATNTLLALGQAGVGLFANAFSLVADAAHTLSDLVTDVLVLVAGRRGAHPADHDHPYGHGRIETAASLLLGAVLVMVGVGFLWSSGQRLQNMAAAPPLHQAALYMALATLVAKEALFRYTLAAARRWKAPMLEANAWHARSDAGSSLVVAIGIGGSLAGYPFLEPLAAAVVGFLIAHMGVRLGLKALRELIDTGLSEQEVARVRATIEATPGVVGLHDVRTRRMADRVLCDAHVQVDPRITVSEGHQISDAVFFRVRAAHADVKEVLVHIDAEDDASRDPAPERPLPDRTEVVRAMGELLGEGAPSPTRIQLHYLGKLVEAEVMLPAEAAHGIDIDALKRRTAAKLRDDPRYRRIVFYIQAAP